MSRTIILTQTGDGYYTAANGQALADKMGFDECLGAVASWMLRPDERLAYSSPIKDAVLGQNYDELRMAVYAASLAVTSAAEKKDAERAAYYAKPQQEMAKP